MTLSTDKRQTLDRIVAELGVIQGVVAVVLGGSHCIGMADETSDLDIGIYYNPESPFDTDDIKIVASKFSTEENFTATGYYEWGPWVNGGGWINTKSGEVDFIYRNVQQVKSTIDDSRNGVWTNDYEQQPPFGFSSVIYLAETQCCHPLHDPQGVIHQLKQSVKVYPPQLRQSVVQQALWAAEFSLWQADKFVKRGDVYNATGCFTRSIKKIVDTLFALNEQYSMGDKYSIPIISKAPICPPQLDKQVEDILSLTKESLPAKAKKMRDLFNQVVVMAGSLYRPSFSL